MCLEARNTHTQNSCSSLSNSLFGVMLSEREKKNEIQLVFVYMLCSNTAGCVNQLTEAMSWVGGLWWVSLTQRLLHAEQNSQSHNYVCVFLCLVLWRRSADGRHSTFCLYTPWLDFSLSQLPWVSPLYWHNKIKLHCRLVILGSALVTSLLLICGIIAGLIPRQVRLSRLGSLLHCVPERRSASVFLGTAMCWQPVERGPACDSP